MLSTLIIVFREALEAILVISIAMVASRGIEASSRWIYAGVTCGLILAMIVALFAEVIAASMAGMGQELFNASVLISASLLMVWSAIWMRRQGKEISDRINLRCSEIKGEGVSIALLAIAVGLAVAREGSEVVLFLHGVAATGGDHLTGMLTGALSGLLLSLAVALLLYRSLVKIPIRLVFSIITFLIVLLAAGMASQGMAYLVMIDAVPALGQMIWNSSGLIAEQSMLGQLLQALMGYDDRPSGMQVLTFILVLSLTWLLIYLQSRPTSGAVAAALMLLSLSLSTMPQNAHAKKVYSPIVEQGELEFEYLVDFSFDTDPSKNGNARHQFELEYAVTDRWMTAVVGDFRKRPGQSFAYQGLKWENIYQLFEQGELWLDAGLYLEYIIPQSSLNKPDVIEFKLLLEKESGRLINTANLVLKKELGANAVNNTSAGYAWRSRWRWMRALEPGVEVYGSIGELGNSSALPRQTHQIGPVLLGKLPAGLSYEIGYLFGLTTTSDKSMLKLVLGYEF